MSSAKRSRPAILERLNYGSGREGVKMMRRLLVLLGILGASFLAIPAAEAEVSGMTLEVGTSATLVAGVYVAVPVTVTCVADEASIFADEIDVSLTQKTGRELAHGSGSLGYQSPAYNGIGFGTPVTCDGLPHNYTVDVFPDLFSDSSSGPFHGGRAVAQAFFSITEFSWQQFFVTAGPTTILIKGGGQ